MKRKVSVSRNVYYVNSQGNSPFAGRVWAIAEAVCGDWEILTCFRPNDPPHALRRQDLEYNYNHYYNLPEVLQAVHCRRGDLYYLNEEPLNLLADVQWILFPRATDKKTAPRPQLHALR